jgi:blocked early in transport 1
MYGRNGYDVEGGRPRGNRSSNGMTATSSSSGGGYANDTNANIMEQQNNERISELSEQVARLKGLTIDIGNEVREQNALLDGLSDGFGNANDLLQNSLRRIGTMLQTTGGKHMCSMVIFCIVVMIFLYWLMRHSGSRGL